MRIPGRSRGKKKYSTAIMTGPQCTIAWQGQGYRAHWFYIYRTFSEHSKWAHVHIFKNVAAFKIMPWRPSQGPLFKAIEYINNSFVLRWHDIKVSNIRLIGADLTQGRERYCLPFSVYLASDVFWKEWIRELFSHKSLETELRERHKAYKVEILRNIFFIQGK